MEQHIGCAQLQSLQDHTSTRPATQHVSNLLAGQDKLLRLASRGLQQETVQLHDMSMEMAAAPAKEAALMQLRLPPRGSCSCLPAGSFQAAAPKSMDASI